MYLKLKKFHCGDEKSFLLIPKSGFSLTHASRRVASRHDKVLKLKVWTLGLYIYKWSEVHLLYAFFETIFL